jgi:hypothetical protein
MPINAITFYEFKIAMNGCGANNDAIITTRYYVVLICDRIDVKAIWVFTPICTGKKSGASQSIANVGVVATWIKKEHRANKFIGDTSHCARLSEFGVDVLFLLLIASFRHAPTLPTASLLSLARRVRDQERGQRGPEVLQPARSRGRVHRQGQTAQALRVRRQGSSVGEAADTCIGGGVRASADRVAHHAGTGRGAKAIARGSRDA